MLRKLVSVSILLLHLCWIPIWAGVQTTADTIEEFVLPRKDGDQGDKIVNSPLMFYDAGGKNGNISAWYATKICFVSPAEGEEIQINFRSFDMSGNAALYIYDGDVTFKSYNDPVPQENLLAKLTGKFSDVSYMSSTGRMAVIYHCKGNGSGAGWEALVDHVVPKDMEFLGVDVSQTSVGDTYPGKKSQPLLSVNVRTEGTNAPFSLDRLAVTLAGTTDLNDLENLQVYATGASASFNASKAIATSSTLEGRLEFQLDRPLSSGDNYFWIAADVKTAAVAGHFIDADCQSVVVGGVERLSAPVAPEESIRIQNIVLMSSGSASYQVGDDPISFYDDGGPEGNISENFSGQVTFSPSAEGKKVMIDFTKLELFESSNKNEILTVYNGPEATDENLIMRVMSGKPILIRSTALGGELTVKLIADTGFPKAGFEATVSQFVPQPMTAEQITVSQFTEGTVSSGDTDQPILSFNIRTLNTEPALTLQNLSFATADTYPVVKGASVYYTGRSEAFDKATLVGRVDVSSNTFQISAHRQVVLTEGDNYFWLAYDISDKAQNGSKIDASLTSVTLSDGVHAVEAGSPEGDRTVENVFFAELGQFQKTVYGSYLYKSVKNPLSYYDGYDPKSGERTVTFLPGTPGHIIELEFSSFAVYYASSSYGVQSRFEVYSGVGTSGELLWKVASTSDASKGPDRLLRSTAPDGALTIVFDSKADGSSSYTAKGFEAEVREYLSVPMEFVSAEAFQASTGALKQGEQNRPLIGFRIDTKGDKNPVLLSKVSINLKGSASQIAKVALYGGVRDSVLTTETPLAELTGTLPDEAVLTLTKPVALPEGASYYWVAVDLKADAAFETVVDASLVSVCVDGTDRKPVSGDPEGSCTVKNIYLLQAGENGTIEVGEQSLMFYDCGGPNDITPNDFQGVVTFVPKNTGQVIKLVFHEWSISGNDNMYFYYGRKAEGSEDKKYRNTSTPDPIVSKADDGSLTVRFRSPSYSYKSDGWAIEVQCYQLKDLSVAGVQVSSVGDTDLLRGSCSVPMLRMDVEIEGDKGDLDVTSLAATLQGSSEGVLVGTQIFTTDTVSSFAPTDLYAECTQGDAAKFDGTYRITEAGVYKFWLTADVAQNAAIDDVLQSAFQLITVSGSEYTPQASETYQGVVKAGFSGTYTIGEEGHFATFKEAIAAMKDGIDGPVVFDILPGNYSELVDVPEINGASQINTITFQSSTHDYRDVLFASNAYSEPPYSDDKMFYEYGVFTLSGADYVTIDGISVTTENNLFPSLIHIKNRSLHATVRNCHLYAAISENFSEDINLICQYAKGLPNHNNDYLTVENCLIEGGYNGVRVAGTSLISLPKQKGARILNNVFRNQGAKSLYVTGERGMVLQGNIFENTESGKSNFNGADITAYDGLVIEGNVFHLATANYSTALYLREMKGSEEMPCTIANNEFRITGGSSSDYCTAISMGNFPSVRIVHNTARVSGINGLLINSHGEHTHAVISNNILLNEQGGYVYKFTTAPALAQASLSHNVVYTAGPQFARIDRDDVATFEAWTATSGENESYFETVPFLSDNALEPSEAGHLVSGEKFDYVTTDLNGTPRADIPTIGAYEFAGEGVVPAFQEGYPVVKGITEQEATVLVKSSMSGKIYALLRENSADTPSADEVLAGQQQDVRKIEEASFRFESLEVQTTYVAYFVLENLRGVRSEVLASEPFTTTYKPTEVSTFEQVVNTSDGFEDGTAVFSGFTIVEQKGCVVAGKRVAHIDGTGSVYISNSTDPLLLTGFYLKAEAPVDVVAYDAADQTAAFTVQPTDGKWIFVNLKDKGKMLMLTLTTEGEAFIDNFSGQPQPMFVYVPDQKVAEGDAVVLDATVSADRGVAPYSYLWTDRNGKTVGTEAKLEFAATTLDEYYIEVKDAWNQTSTDHVSVRVEGEAYVATFEETELAPESYWNGENPDDMDVGKFSFLYSGSYIFSVNKHAETWWSGSALSNQTSTEFVGLKDQYRSAAGGGHNSDNYIVSYVTSFTPNYIEVTNRKEGDNLRGFYITNAAYTKNSVLNGDGMCEPFVQGDYLKLIIHGKHADKSVSTLEYYLADYRSENEADHYCTDTWEWLDLSSLGAVTELTFDFEGTQNNEWGLLTPTYFCMDDFNGRQAVDSVDVTVENQLDIDLISYFSDFSTEAAASYELLTDILPEGFEASLSEGVLRVSATQKTDAELLIRAVQGGKNRLLHLTIHADVTGINGTSASQVSVYPVPATTQIIVSAPWQNYRVELFSMDGTKVLDDESHQPEMQLPVSQFARGSYLLKVTSAEGSVMHRVLLVE